MTSGEYLDKDEGKQVGGPAGYVSGSLEAE